MIELLSEIKENLEQDNYKNERAVEQQIVFPVLKELGWNINNPSQIEPQYELKWQATEKGKKVEKRRVVDYALLVDKKARVIIEVKAVGNLKEADSQLFEYAFHVGTPLAILTDGHKWRVYYCYGTGNYDERLVRSLDLYDSPHEVMEYLSRYLAFAEVKSKKAEKNARKDLENKTNKESAKKTIPKAWKKIAVDEPDELVDRLIEETAQEASGIAPNKDDVIAFLKNLTSPEITLSPQRVEQPQSTAPHSFTK
ncbi:MAG: type I restriction endonuclease, partial [Alphaproteobacteria bacterium]|nr:type I restriction endonuclease [Alphaproteobacteria bacterium]